MYISFYSKRNPGKIVTLKSEIVTKKNLKFFEELIHYFEYLYFEALIIISNGDIDKRYHTEYINKKDGTKRRIDEPDDVLKKYQRKLVDIFTNKLNLVFPSSVYGFVKGRNRIQMTEIHKKQYQIIKMDIKDFFPSCTLEWILDSMAKVYPFCLVNRQMLETILIPCVIKYNGMYRLPQGAPSSPILSNIGMIPIDYNIESELNVLQYAYTRYADDIYISHGELFYERYMTAEEKLLCQIFGETPNISIEAKNSFIRKTSKDAINTVKKILQLNPMFSLKDTKTKLFYTTHGNVKMLGISVGEKVGIGNKNKQTIKSMIWNFLCQTEKWDKKRTQQMLGILANARYIEPEFVIKYISFYEVKTGKNFYNEVRKILCS